jgi:TFIIF-interacting CTD phosphatase-like protein
MGEIHIFTASARSYADPVIDAIDPNGYITGRYYRDHCSMDKKGNVVKPIDIISKNWKKIIVIDDSEIVYNMYRGKFRLLFFIIINSTENTILVEAWSPLKGRK